MAPSTTTGAVPVPRCPVIFNGQNYRDWVQHMKLHMRGQLVWEHLSGALPCPMLPTPPAELAFPVDADETKQREMLDAFEEATEEYQNQLHLYKQWTNDDA